VSDDLILRGGASARKVLRENGYSPDLFSTLVGASGGPKWLVLSQLDRVLVEDFILPRRTELDMIGSSIGSFRHVCFAQADPLAAIERLEAAYIAQAYEERPDAAEITRQSREIVEVLLGDTGASEVSVNPRIHTHMIVARMRGVENASGPRFLAALGAAILLNAVHRRALGGFFERAIFSSEHARSVSFPDFATHQLKLCEGNLHEALLAGGSIPLVMEGIKNIDQAPKGLYLDGGIIDYHFDFRFEPSPGLILYPHFFERITPGWLDKAFPWRTPTRAELDSTLVISPSREFIQALPGGRVPDRKDFERMTTSERTSQWRAIVDQCRALADSLHDLISGGRLVERIEAFE
jgi:hypothetical protein